MGIARGGSRDHDLPIVAKGKQQAGCLASETVDGRIASFNTGLVVDAMNDPTRLVVVDVFLRTVPGLFLCVAGRWNCRFDVMNIGRSHGTDADDGLFANLGSARLA